MFSAQIKPEQSMKIDQVQWEYRKLHSTPETTDVSTVAKRYSAPVFFVSD